MSFAAAVISLGILCLGNILLTFGILRRLRVHEERWSKLGADFSPSLDTIIGRRIPDLNDETAPGVRLVGFFSAGCGSCLEQALKFAEHDDYKRVAIVVIGSASETDGNTLIRALDGSPTVILEPASTKLSDRLGLRSYPVLLHVDGTGIVLRAEHSIASLTAASLMK